MLNGARVPRWTPLLALPMLCVLVSVFYAPAPPPLWMQACWTMGFTVSALGVAIAIASTLRAQGRLVAETLRDLGFRELTADHANETVQSAMRELARHTGLRSGDTWRACWRGGFDGCDCTVRLGPVFVSRNSPAAAGCLVAVSVEPIEPGVSLRPIGAMESRVRSVVAPDTSAQAFEARWNIIGNRDAARVLLTDSARLRLEEDRMLFSECWIWTGAHLYLYTPGPPTAVDVRRALARATAVVQAAGIQQQSRPA